jgi:predicted alpha-1,2-mannosidase
VLIITACDNKDLGRYVDPHIGGVSILTTLPTTVDRPHSMVRVYPVTKPGLDRYLSDKIYGFALNMPAYRMGHVTDIMPTQGEISLNRDSDASFYDHDQEEVHPWYQRVYLEDKGINAECTTTERAVLYRFTFSKKDSCNLIFRSAGHALFKIISDSIVTGWEEFKGSRQYFYAKFSKGFSRYGTFSRDSLCHTLTMKEGQGIGVIVSFKRLQVPIEVRIGISYIDASQARDNLIRETNEKSFDKVVSDSHRIWTNTLNLIRVEGGTEKQKRIFYTCLYRASERMVDISEYGRYYSGYDHQIHSDNGRPFYVDDWLWDTFRGLHPLWTILAPGQQGDMVQSYVDIYEQSGWIPGFPQFYGDFPAMIGFHSAALVLDTYQKGICNFDIEKAYEGLKKNAMEATMLPWRNGPACYLDSFYYKHGWYPALPEGSVEPVSLVDGFEKRQAVSLSLADSYDSWCLAQLAKALKKPKDYKYFMRRSQNYRKVFNPKTGFMAPKMANGKWVEPFDPQLSGGIGSRMYFTENNTWIWSFNVLHDIPGLIKLMGGNDKFVDRLDELFNEPTEIAKWQFMGRFPDASGLNGMFPAGNEPSFHVPYLYDYAGKPWKTQRRIREIMKLWFDDTPLGFPGDEDGGAMSSWYIFSAMGFYPVTPGSGLYAIGSPFFKKITITLPSGKKFCIQAKNCSEKNKYIQSARLNGKNFNRAWIKHSEIMTGGTLEFQMGETPNKNWGVNP